MMTTEADFQQMIKERLKKVEEIRNCLKLSMVSTDVTFSYCLPSHIMLIHKGTIWLFKKIQFQSS